MGIITGRQHCLKCVLSIYRSTSSLFVVDIFICCIYQSPSWWHTFNLSLSVAKTIATALVSSTLDYCNSLLYNTANNIARLQHVQNCLARVVTHSPHFSSSVPLLKPLDWLPVHYRIIFRICTISYQALASKQPTYLNSMLTPARNSREQRSTHFTSLGLRQKLGPKLSRLLH